MPWRDTVFQYDGTFDGFLCCVFDSYSHKEFPVAFSSGEECISLYETRYVVTVRQHAQRVFRSICALSSDAAAVLRRAFLTCLEDKERRLYAFVKKLYEEGPLFLRNPSDPVYYPIAKALRHMDGELEKLRGFIRFSDYHGVLGAEIEPKNRVLPLLRRHFCERYANESFFIYDKVHKEVLLYSAQHQRLIPLDTLQLAMPDETEMQFRTLWKRFYNTIAITERANPRCQNTFLPKRYRGNMTEFLPVDYEKHRAVNSPLPQENLPSASVFSSPAVHAMSASAQDLPNPSDTAAALPDFYAQDVIPVPVKRTGSAPSAPVSDT